jgi:hypothetical protein
MRGDPRTGHAGFWVETAFEFFFIVSAHLFAPDGVDAKRRGRWRRRAKPG